jgi:hypothetical protein
MAEAVLHGRPGLNEAGRRVQARPPERGEEGLVDRSSRPARLWHQTITFLFFGAGCVPCPNIFCGSVEILQTHLSFAKMGHPPDCAQSQTE